MLICMARPQKHISLEKSNTDRGTQLLPLYIDLIVGDFSYLEILLVVRNHALEHI